MDRALEKKLSARAVELGRTEEKLAPHMKLKPSDSASLCDAKGPGP